MACARPGALFSASFVGGTFRHKLIHLGLQLFHQAFGLFQGDSAAQLLVLPDLLSMDLTGELIDGGGLAVGEVEESSSQVVDEAAALSVTSRVPLLQLPIPLRAALVLKGEWQ